MSLPVDITPTLSQPKSSPPAAPKVRQVKSISHPQLIVKPAALVTSKSPVDIQAQEPALNTTNIDADGSGSTASNLAFISETGTDIPKEDTDVHSISSIEAYPEFPGGEAAFAKYLSRNLRYPELARENGIYGKILVSFIIEKNGDLSNIAILRGIGSGCDEEAIRVLSKSPKWKAGIQNKQNVRVAYTIPIHFKLPQ